MTKMLGQILVLLLFVVLAAATSADLDRSVVLELSELRKVGTVDEKYLSFAIDSHVIAERWKNFDFDPTWEYPVLTNFKFFYYSSESSG